MLKRPSYIHASLAAVPLDFRWSNVVAVSFGDPDAQPMDLARAIWTVNYKAKAALALTCVEWVAWRLCEQTDVTDVLQRIEAAWASTVDPTYARSLDLDDVRDDVHRAHEPDGPRQTALVLLDRWHFGWRKSLAGLEQISIMCAHLARHVTSSEPGFETWLQQVLTALAAAYPCSTNFDRGARKFDHSAEPPVPRAWFESLTAPPDPAADRVAWASFFGGLNPADNPYLALATKEIDA